MSPAASEGALYADLIVEAFERHGDREAFVHGDRRLTYAEAKDFTARLVQVLARHGVGRGSAVAALSPNAPEAWLLQAAAYLVGASFSGLHPLGSVDDHVRLCDDAGVALLLVHPRFAEVGAAVSERAPSVHTVLTIGPSELGRDVREACAAESGGRLVRDPAIEPEDTAWLQYTGGTTGRPKGVMLPQRALTQQALSWLASYGVPEQPRYLAAAPITHAAVLPLLPTLLRGGCVVLHEAFDPEAFLRTVQDEHISYAFGVPTMLGALVETARHGTYDLGALRTFAYGAAPASPALVQEAQEVFGPVLLQGYGQTESGGFISSLRPDEHIPGQLTSCGRPAVGVRLQLHDAEGREVPSGEPGEIVLRSRAVMTGYLHLPEETAQALRGGWLHTGDIGRFDERGFLHIVDRAKDMVITGGFNVYPREVEDVLTGHPGVAGAAVVGVPDDRWGEAVRAYVVLRREATATADELIALVRRQKGPVHAPKSVVFVPELPTTAVGKIDKKVLRDLTWAGRDRQVN
ncbi:AMP-binding protein [Pseudonocardia kujensis]|uniref:AMP-binding protein n=1 Tax=Pseudonocardia kujensis TaxID=1128675 RepID=UPI001E5206BE|nr:AMP-binding protein [Pseudonocardia kujensis]MCE0764987.1 AMP-binding protein [Pseudonocardia kujensis]